MKSTEMALGSKVSGKLLHEGDENAVWSKAGRLKAVAGVLALHKYVVDEATDAAGAYVVTGAGNGGFRGRELVAEQDMDTETADHLGLMGTMMNARVMAGDLKRHGVPHRMLLAPNVRLVLPGMEAWPEANADSLQECFDQDEVAVIAAGSGMLNQSTDKAVQDYAEELVGVGVNVALFKGTGCDGVYDGDPNHVPPGGKAPRLLRQVNTGTMREHSWLALDRPGIDGLEERGFHMRVHSLDLTVPEVLARNVGTLVVPDPRVEAPHELAYA